MQPSVCGTITRGTTDLEAGVVDAEIVAVCTPVSRIADDVRRAAEAAPGDVVVTDAGSSKRQIVESVERNSRSAAVFVGRIRWPVPRGGASTMRVAICSRIAFAY